MKKTFNSILTLGVLLAVGLACNFTTANLSDVSFARDQEGSDKITTAKAGDKIYVLSSVNNAGGKYKVKWEAFQPNGDEIDIPQNEIAVDGSRPVWFTFTVPPSFPDGRYKFSVTLTDESDGKQIDKKSGSVLIKGNGGSTESSSDADDGSETMDETSEDFDEE